jgi:hypothetical protein
LSPLLLSVVLGSILTCTVGPAALEFKSTLAIKSQAELYCNIISHYIHPTATMTETTTEKPKTNARFLLGLVALFLGELRDGLTMINMQSAFLIVSKHYSEKQAGVLFFVFGMSQFLFQTPAGYIMDYTDRKVHWLGLASVVTTLLTLLTATTAKDYGENLGFMVFVKFIQVRLWS